LDCLGLAHIKALLTGGTTTKQVKRAADKAMTIKVDTILTCMLRDTFVIIKIQNPSKITTAGHADLKDIPLEKRKSTGIKKRKCPTMKHPVNSRTITTNSNARDKYLRVFSFISGGQ